MTSRSRRHEEVGNFRPGVGDLRVKRRGPELRIHADHVSAVFVDDGLGVVDQHSAVFERHGERASLPALSSFTILEELLARFARGGCATLKVRMIEALMFNLDSRLAAANEVGDALFAPPFQAIRWANQGEGPED